MKKPFKISLIVISLALGVLFGSMIPTDHSSPNRTTDPKSSDPLGYNIHIDGNWTITESTYEWCTGAGSSSDPYVIQDIEIDADGDYGIFVENAANHFRIENVTIYDAGSTSATSSIVLDNVNNGHILACHISNGNQYGAYMTDSSNCLWEYNTIEDNVAQGLDIYMCSDIEIWHNSISNNGQYGLRLESSSSNCDIWNNTFNGLSSQNYAIWVDQSDDNTIRENSILYHTILDSIVNMDSDRTNITHNVISNNYNGIWIQQSFDLDITGNNLTDNTNIGIRCIGDFDNNQIEENLFDSNLIGLDISSGCDSNTITMNTFQDNTQHGVKINAGDNNLLNKNAFITNAVHALDNVVSTKWNNSDFGNYWDTYGGSDPDHNGIGNTAFSDLTDIVDYLPLMVTNASLLNDNDGDTLSDYEELNGWLNPFSGEPTNPYAPDSDGDGLTDGEEITGGANLYDGNPTNPNLGDMDGDGYTDGEEVTGSANTFDGSPTNPDDVDTDGDTFDDNVEIPLGHDPLDPWEFPKPDLVILSNYSFDGEYISITIKNSGDWDTSGVTVLVNLSTGLVLYNETLSGFGAVNETKEIRILKSQFDDGLIEGESYFLSIYVDPISAVNESSETNNSEEDILYTHNTSSNPGDPNELSPFQLALIIVSSIIVLIASIVTLSALSKRKKQKKEFRPMQLMILEKKTSALIYNHNFSINPNERKKDLAEMLANWDSEEDELENDMDEILTAGAFSGIQTILKNILKTDKGINEISHGEYSIYFHYGTFTTTVLIATGKFHSILSKIRKFSERFESEFKNELAEFDGRIDIFFRASKIVEKFFPK